MSTPNQPVTPRPAKTAESNPTSAHESAAVHTAPVAGAAVAETAAGATSTSTKTSTNTTVKQPAKPALDPETQEVLDGLDTKKRGGGRTAAVWAALIVGMIVLVLLLIFIVQNNVKTNFVYFNQEFTLPLGVAMLLAAIAGALVMALVGSVRMFQMSWQLRKLRKQQNKVAKALR